jgi:hypothetical protein
MVSRMVKGVLTGAFKPYGSSFALIPQLPRLVTTSSPLGGVQTPLRYQERATTSKLALRVFVTLLPYELLDRFSSYLKVPRYRGDPYAPPRLASIIRSIQPLCQTVSAKDCRHSA